MAGNARAMRAT